MKAKKAWCAGRLPTPRWERRQRIKGEAPPRPRRFTASGDGNKRWDRSLASSFECCLPVGGPHHTGSNLGEENHIRQGVAGFLLFIEPLQQGLKVEAVE
jgi:hypothetical protein